MDYNTESEEIRQRYYSRMQKKIAGKPLPIQLIMERTYSSACLILGAIEGVPFYELAMSVYFFCKDVQFREVVRQYDAQLELAGANPEKFVFGLHAFYNSVISKIRKENKYSEFAEFLATVMRIQLEMRGKVNYRIVDAYLSLVLQTFEYMRPNKFDLDSCVYGVSSEGKLLVGPYPYAYSDLPGIEVQRALAQGTMPKGHKELWRFIQQAYAKQGIVIHSQDDLNRLEQVQRIHISTTAALLPYINEYTWDIVPINVFNSVVAPLQELSSNVHVDVDNLKEKLRHRRYTLPTNGVSFEFDDPSGELKAILMKELAGADRVTMLYRIDCGKGSIAGYYDTREGYLFSVIREATTQAPFQNLTELILILYASQVLSATEVPDISSCFMQAGAPLGIKAYGRGGRLRNTYHAADPSGEHRTLGARDPAEFTSEARSINGFVRKLPEGQVASEEAKAMAERYGYDLAPGETYVRPFIKSVFVKRQENNTEEAQQT